MSHSPESGQVAAFPATYCLNEGRLALPPGFTDRSTQLFLPDKPDTSAHLSVARDRFEPGESIEDYVARQIGILKKKLPGHQVLRRQPALLGRDPNAIAGQQIDAVYRNGQHRVHQRQAAFAVPGGPGVLVLSGSGPKPLDDAFEMLWRQWLASFEPWPEQAPPADTAA